MPEAYIAMYLLIVQGHDFKFAERIHQFEFIFFIVQFDFSSNSKYYNIRNILKKDTFWVYMRNSFLQFYRFIEYLFAAQLKVHLPDGPLSFIVS